MVVNHLAPQAYSMPSEVEIELRRLVQLMIPALADEAS